MFQFRSGLYSKIPYKYNHLNILCKANNDYSFFYYYLQTPLTVFQPGYLMSFFLIFSQNKFACFQKNTTFAIRFGNRAIF